MLRHTRSHDGNALLETVVALPLLLLLGTAGLDLALAHADKAALVDGVRSCSLKSAFQESHLLHDVWNGDIDRVSVSTLVDSFQESLAGQLRATQAPSRKSAARIHITAYALAFDSTSGMRMNQLERIAEAGDSIPNDRTTLEAFFRDDTIPSRYSLPLSPIDGVVHFAPRVIALDVRISTPTRDFSHGLLSALLGKGYSIEHADLVVPRNQY